MSKHRFFFFLLLLLSLSTLPTFAQDDAFDLSTELYTLSNDGVVERVGLGITGREIVTNETEFVVDFGVAPDGIWLAYRTDQSLNFLNMLDGSVQVIEAGTASIPPFRGRGQTIAWSPDSQILAYTTENGIRLYSNGLFFDIPITPILHLSWSPQGGFLAAEAEDNVWWIYRRDQNGMLVLHSAIPSSFGVTWVEETILMFAPDTGGLFLMDLANANAQAQIADDSVVYRNPKLYDERAVYVFGRPVSDTLTVETGGFLYEATITDRWVVEQVSESSVDLAGLRWSPEGNLLTTLFGGVLTLVDPVSATGVPLPLSGVVAYGWGPEFSDTNELTLPADAFFLADDFVVGNQIWTLPRGTAPGFPVTQVENTVSDYAVAPDNVTFAYISDGDIYLLPADADDSILIAEDANPTAISFDDTGEIFFYDAGAQIFSVNLADATLTPQVFLDGYTSPRFVPGGLLVRIPDGDLAFYEPTTANLQRLGAYRDVVPLQDGQFVGLGAPIVDDLDGLYLIDTGGSAPPSLIFTPASDRMVVDAVEVAPGQIRLATASRGMSPKTVEIWQLRVSGGTPLPVADVGYMGEPVFSPDGEYIGGYASAARTLIIHEIQSGLRNVFRQIPPVMDFHWGVFR